MCQCWVEISDLNQITFFWDFLLWSDILAWWPPLGSGVAKSNQNNLACLSTHTNQWPALFLAIHPIFVNITTADTYLLRSTISSQLHSLSQLRFISQTRLGNLIKPTLQKYWLNNACLGRNIAHFFSEQWVVCFASSTGWHIWKSMEQSHNTPQLYHRLCGQWY